MLGHVIPFSVFIDSKLNTVNSCSIFRFINSKNLLGVAKFNKKKHKKFKERNLFELVLLSLIGTLAWKILTTFANIFRAF